MVVGVFQCDEAAHTLRRRAGCAGVGAEALKGLANRSFVHKVDGAARRRPFSRWRVGGHQQTARRCMVGAAGDGAFGSGPLELALDGTASNIWSRFQTPLRNSSQGWLMRWASPSTPESWRMMVRLGCGFDDGVKRQAIKKMSNWTCLVIHPGSFLSVAEFSSVNAAYGVSTAYS